MNLSLSATCKKVINIFRLDYGNKKKNKLRQVNTLTDCRYFIFYIGDLFFKHHYATITITKNEQEVYYVFLRSTGTKQFKAIH